MWSCVVRVYVCSVTRVRVKLCVGMKRVSVTALVGCRKGVKVRVAG